jgi:hypothetical protein
MTTLVDRTAPPTRMATLRTLAGLEARRYARHPLFLIGVAFLVIGSFTGGTAATGAPVNPEQQVATILPAFFLGLLGVFVGHQLARSMAASTEAVEASPADGVIRTGALCLACLVPGAVALAWTACMSLVMALKPVPVSAALSSTDRGAMIAASVVYAVGGPLFGVLVGPWTRFPGAGLVAALVLVAWTFLGTFGLLMPASRLGTLIHLNAPFTSWVSSDGPNAPLWLAGGSPWWYLAYIAALCGLAATAAMFHEAVGARRSRLSRVLAVLAVVAVASLLLAAAPDPTRLTL